MPFLAPSQSLEHSIWAEEQALQTIMAAMTGGPIEVSAGLKRAISVDVNKDDMLEIAPGAAPRSSPCVLASYKNKTVCSTAACTPVRRHRLAPLLR